MASGLRCCDISHHQLLITNMIMYCLLNVPVIATNLFIPQTHFNDPCLNRSFEFPNVNINFIVFLYVLAGLQLFFLVCVLITTCGGLELSNRFAANMMACQGMITLLYGLVLVVFGVGAAIQFIRIKQVKCESNEVRTYIIALTIFCLIVGVAMMISSRIRPSEDTKRELPDASPRISKTNSSNQL